MWIPTRGLILAIGCLLVTQVAFAQDRPASSQELTSNSDPAADRDDRSRDENIRFFESRVRPLLAKRCYECHGAENQEGELRLDQYAGMLRGGASGAVLIPGRPDESLLFAAIGYRNEELQMPPDAKLPEDEISILREWISRGLPHPESTGKAIVPQSSINLEEGRQFWAFQPPVAGPLPIVNDLTWSRSPVDRFILARLETSGLRPADPADKATWLRRVTSDLTGLPPSMEELDAFLADSSATASSKVIDRLLNSPRYGERWGRHWLDIVRYADSNGLDENVAHGNAWRYRDYVIEAFNNDKPFDQFVREQIAGDLLPASNESQRHEYLIATGFLGLGPKVLAEVDEVKMEMDIVDEQLDTFGRVFLGLTMGCARCHDHKFDPIRADDYYALAGIFQSTRTMENFKKVARWHENSIATPTELAAQAAHERKIAEQKAAIQATIDSATQALAAAAGAGASLPKDPEKQFSEATKAELKQQRDELKKLEKAPPPISTAMGATEGTAVDAAICLRGSHLTRGKVVPRGVPAVLIANPLEISPSRSGRLELVGWLTDEQNPLLARVIVNRVWRWHFGRGIVETTDNFGRLGERPSHPELLDWMAVWFMDHGWSLKELHRLILNSSTYGQSSALSSASSTEAKNVAKTVDPDNRMLWRFPIRRLEAEAIRDSLLSVSGQLDHSMGGSLLHVGNREYLFDHTSKDNTNYDSRKRTVYLPVVRNNLYDLCQLFDATDATVPSGDRASSTVATQALLMMNSSLVIDSARALAQISVEAGDERSRVRWLIKRCFGRDARDQEVEKALEFLTRFPLSESVSPPASSNKELLASSPSLQSHAAWVSYCHALLAANEFIYIR